MASPAQIAAMQNYPLQPPPPGQTSNFDDPESRALLYIIPSSIFLSIMWLILILRIYSKVRVIRKFWWDDACAIFASLGITVFVAMNIWAINTKTIGRHSWDVRAIWVTPKVIRTRLLGAGTILYCPTVISTKLALYLFYYRMFVVKPWMRIAIYFGIIHIVLFYTACMIFILSICIPGRDESWTSKKFGTRCKRAGVLNPVVGSVGLVTDIYIFILPFFILLGLQLSLRKKLEIGAIFFAGFVAIIACSFGLYFRMKEWTLSDLSWTSPPVSLAAVVELTLGIICGSVPYLPALFRRHSPKFSPAARLQELHSKYWTRLRSRDSERLHHVQSSLKDPQQKNFQVETRTLGSIQGKGNFVKSGIFSEAWGNQSTMERSSDEAVIDNSSSTRRSHYEMESGLTNVMSSKPSQEVLL